MVSFWFIDIMSVTFYTLIKTDKLAVVSVSEVFNKTHLCSLLSHYRGKFECIIVTVCNQ